MTGLPSNYRQLSQSEDDHFERGPTGDLQMKDSGASGSTQPAILLMGATGVGKSTFIARLTGASVGIGRDLEPCTEICEGWDYSYDEGTVITLIDTPGFDDPHRADMNILQAVIQYLTSKPFRIIAIIYLHRITDTRVTGTTRTNLRMLQALCGEHFYQNVVLATTMWSKASAKAYTELENRETELKQSRIFWADMIAKGSTYVRYLDTVESGKEMLSLCLARDTSTQVPRLKVFLQLGQQTPLEDTEAGMILTEAIRKREEQQRLELEEEREEMEALRAEQEEKKAEIEAIDNAMRKEQILGSTTDAVQLPESFRRIITLVEAIHDWPRRMRQRFGFSGSNTHSNTADSSTSSDQSGSGKSRWATKLKTGRF